MKKKTCECLSYIDCIADTLFCRLTVSDVESTMGGNYVMIQYEFRKTKLQKLF